MPYYTHISVHIVNISFMHKHATFLFFNWRHNIYQIMIMMHKMFAVYKISIGAVYDKYIMHQKLYLAILFRIAVSMQSILGPPLHWEACRMTRVIKLPRYHLHCFGDLSKIQFAMDFFNLIEKLRNKGHVKE